MGDVKLTVKYKDENFEFDTAKPEEVEKAQTLISKGLLWDKEKQNELGLTRKELEELKPKYEKAKQAQELVDNYNARLTLAKTNEEERKRFFDELESMGIKPTKKEKDAIEDDDLTDPEVKSLKTKVDKLEETIVKERQERDEERRFQFKEYLDNRFNALEEKYNSEDYKGYPKFDREKVLDYANKIGTTEYEDAYFAMNRNEIIEAEKQKIIDAEKTLKDKRLDTQLERDGKTISPVTSESAKDYDHAVELALKKAQQEGKSFTTED